MTATGSASTFSLPQHPANDPASQPRRAAACIALVGNPNAGKTTLFNQLTGLRAKTANFPGTTIEHRHGRLNLGGRTVELLDLPGLYSLNASNNEERVARDAILGHVPGLDKPDALIVLQDATNLERNLFLASQAMELGVPTIVALNMIDLADRNGTKIDVQALSKELGCPVVAVAARSGRGIEQLRHALEVMLDPSATPTLPLQPCAGCTGCQFEHRYNWAEGVGSRVIGSPAMTHGRRTEAIDRILTHPVVGVVAFLTVMFAVFAMIFWVAQYPMGAIDTLFGQAGGWVAAVLDWISVQLPAGGVQNFVNGDLRSLLIEGVIGGVGGVLVFLPQILILFFFLSLLEDTGYLARAAFVMDRLMRFVGLPGKAFVPMLSAHACAIPAIMATRVIDDRRDRMVTILVLPLLTCSARIPVYAMVVALLFAHSPLLAAAMFTGAYLLGIVATMATAWVFKRTILRGESKPLVIELPSYKMPSIRNALWTMADRAWIFIHKAGTVILVASIILWALANYPKSAPPAGALALQQQAQALEAQGDDAAAELSQQADDLINASLLSNSIAGRIGHIIEPAIKPLGMDWQMGIGILSSLAAREVFVSTLAVVYGVGADAADEQPERLYDTMRQSKRSNGQPTFTTATCISLLIFYVLAMQCLATTAVVRRETGGWKWPLFQIAYMTGLAYVCSLIAFQTLHALGVA
ncbi:MAG: ferrous iron transporter B [Phycisphaeraceae bacterium]